METQWKNGLSELEGEIPIWKKQASFRRLRIGIHDGMTEFYEIAADTTELEVFGLKELR